jgi:hypothetical protein
MIFTVYGRKYKVDWYHSRHEKPVPVKVIWFHGTRPSTVKETFKIATTGCEMCRWDSRAKKWHHLVVADTMCMIGDNFSRRMGRKKSFTKAVMVVSHITQNKIKNPRLWRTRVWAQYKAQIPNDFK